MRDISLTGNRPLNLSIPLERLFIGLSGAISTSFLELYQRRVCLSNMTTPAKQKSHGFAVFDREHVSVHGINLRELIGHSRTLLKSEFICDKLQQVLFVLSGRFGCCDRTDKSTRN